MDFSDLYRRAAEVLPNVLQVSDDGEARLSDDFEALHRDIEIAMHSAGGDEELQMLAETMTLMKETLANPEIAKTMAATMSNDTAAPEPQPEIFDAIEDGDLNRVREALKTWDVNATHGPYKKTALYSAMSGFETSLEIINFLLDAGADPRKGLSESNVLNGLGFANTTSIAPDDLMRVVNRCVDLGADIEQRSDKLQWTPLITAASEWNPVATEALLMAGADIKARAGEVDGVCFSGSDSFAFADGHPETMAVLKRYAVAS